MAADQTRRQVLNAAGEIFAARGFKKATVREICASANVNLASVNYHFGDKERLYIEAVKHARQLLEEQEPLPEWSPSTPPEEKLRLFVLAMVRRMLNPSAAPWQLRLITREILEPTRAAEEMVEESFRPYFQLLVEIVGEMVPPDTTTPRLHQLALSVFGQMVFYRAHGRIVSLLIDEQELQSHYQPDRLAEHVTSFSLAAIRAFGSSGSAPLVSSDPVSPS